MNPEPDYEEALGLINHLPTNDLKELMNNEDKLIELIKGLPQIKNIISEKEMLLITNKSLADYNMSLQPKLNQGKYELISKYDESAALQERINDMKIEMCKITTKQVPDVVQALLQTAAKEKEEETEELVQKFLTSDDIQVDVFIATFISEKTVAHSRLIKADKMSELLTQNRNSLNINPSVVTTPWATPYPTQLPNMPLPPYIA